MRPYQAEASAVWRKQLVVVAVGMLIVLRMDYQGLVVLGKNLEWWWWMHSGGRYRT